MNTIISLFDYKKALDFKSFVVSLVISLIVFLLLCWAFGFLLTILGQKGMAEILIMVFSGVFLARIVVLLLRLVRNNNK